MTHKSRETVFVVVPFLLLSDSNRANDGTVELAEDQWSIADGENLTLAGLSPYPKGVAVRRLAAGPVSHNALAHARALALTALALPHALPILPSRVARR